MNNLKTVLACSNHILEYDIVSEKVVNVEFLILFRLPAVMVAVKEGILIFGPSMAGR